MKHKYLKRLFRHLWLLLLLGNGVPAVAQPETYNWKFGNRAGITFPAGGGPAITSAPGSLTSSEGCASISDASGVLQCYTNGMQVWDRQGGLMPGGTLTGSNTSASQAALLVRAPDQAARYYLFTVDAVENALRGGLRYSTVEMSLRGGLGDVTSPNSVPVPLPGGVLSTEKLTAVRHANGRDYWIVVHGWLNNSFYCYLLNPSGLSTTPVVSAVGSAHAGSGIAGDNSIGYLRASPNSLLLAAAPLNLPVELFTFDPATGQVSAPRTIPRQAPFHYGLEFSPDNSKLYLSNGTQVYQIDLANNLAATSLPVTGGGAQAMQRGPDGQIYVTIFGTTRLAIIHSPNLAGTACNLDATGFTLASGGALIGLPNFPNSFSLPVNFNVPSPVCVGTRVAVSAIAPLATLTYTWDFGDPSGAANTATGPTAAHTYAQVGTYTITLTGTPVAGGVGTTAQRTVVVAPLPTLSLSPRQRTLCAGQSLVLAAGNQPTGTTYRWQDGSTAATYTVRAGGRYVLAVTSASGCTARDSVDVTLAPLPVVRLAAPTVLCTPADPVVLQANAQPAGYTYRWQDGTTTAIYLATRPGRYRLQVSSPAGCTSADSVEVRGPQVDGECVPILIPNVITPNADAQNDFFVLQGLIAANWEVTVYNRWGRQVFKQTGYDNRWDAAGQPAGPYYYLLQNTLSGQQRKGWVEVVK